MSDLIEFHFMKTRQDQKIFEFLTRFAHFSENLTIECGVTIKLPRSSELKKSNFSTVMKNPVNLSVEGTPGRTETASRLTKSEDLCPRMLTSLTFETQRLTVVAFACDKPLWVMLYF
jgi:hypothetical protein